MKERICMVKNCPLRRQHKETKQLFCIVGEQGGKPMNNQNQYLMPVVVAGCSGLTKKRIGGGKTVWMAFMKFPEDYHGKN